MQQNLFDAEEMCRQELLAFAKEKKISLEQRLFKSFDPKLLIKNFKKLKRVEQ